MIEKLKTEKGAVHIVEATIVFPIMFLIIFMMITVGNAYLMKCRVESVVVQMAYYGAAQCADPLVKAVSEGNAVPEASNEHEVLPYRYLFNSKEMDKIESNVRNQISSKVKKLGTGFFGGMSPKMTIPPKAEFNNMFLYSTFSVEVEYKVMIPVRIYGMDDWFSMKFSSRIDVPVSDTPEFVRNIAMLEDWIVTTETGEKFLTAIGDALNEVKPFLN